MASIDRIPGIGPALRAALADIGVSDTTALAMADAARLTTLRGISAGRAEAFIAAARAILKEDAVASAATPKPGKPKGKAEKKKADKAKSDKTAAKKTGDKKKKKSDKAKAKAKGARKAKK